MKKICILIVFILLFASLTSCSLFDRTADVPDTETSYETETAEYGEVISDTEGGTEFITEETDGETADTDEPTQSNVIAYADAVIVRADIPTKAVKTAAIDLRKGMMAMTKESIALTTDWEEVNENGEILVGDTNRRKAEGLKLGEFRITREGRNIYILGGSDKGVTEGVAYFCENFLTPDGIKIADGYDYLKKEKSMIEGFSISGKKLTSVSIYAGEYGGSYATKLAALIKESAGISTSLTQYKNRADIVFTESDSSVPTGEWGITANGNILNLVVKSKVEAKRVFEYISSLVDGTSGVLDLSGLVHHAKQMTAEEYRKTKQLVIYPEFPDKIGRIYDYDVSVTMDGKTSKLPVYNHVVDSNVSRRPGLDEYRRFSMFAFSGGSVRVDIKVKKDFRSYTVFPSAKNFKHDFKDGVISVYLDKPDYFGIQLDDDQNTILSVFADYPEFKDELPEKGDENVLYIEGWYEPEGGKLKIDKAGTSVYIAPGAVLNTRIYFDAPNCELTGRGAIVDPFENIYEYDIRDGGTESAGYHLVNTGSKATNFLYDGPVMLDARTYNITASGANLTVRNVKAMSAMMTSDGIGTGARNVLVEHCWFYVGDNCLVTSGTGGLAVRDTALGTTCAAMFPQCDADNQTFDDIYVFRADDGIINHRYNGSIPVDRAVSNITYNRISAMEMPTGLTHFFQGRNMGVLPKTFNFNDISLPRLAQVIRYDNDGNNLYTDSYSLNFNNVSVAGSVLTGTSGLTITNSMNSKNSESVTKSGSFTPVKRNEKTVNYTAPGKIYIGSAQVFFENAPKISGGKLSLPAKEISAILGTAKIGGSEYVTTDELIKANVLKSAKQGGGDSWYLTPVYNGRNFFADDDGEISMYAENSCYQLDLVTHDDAGTLVYTVYSNPKSPSTSAGISRSIIDEVRMYGTGTYRISFYANACTDGTIRVEYSGATTQSRSFGVDKNMRNYTFDITVKDTDLKSKKCVLVFTGAVEVLDWFAFSDFSFTKIG